MPKNAHSCQPQDGPLSVPARRPCLAALNLRLGFTVDEKILFDWPYRRFADYLKSNDWGELPATIQGAIVHLWRSEHDGANAMHRKAINGNEARVTRSH